jgi:hypothetical protein
MDNLNTSANVYSFINAVHYWQEKVKESTSKERTGDLLITGVFVSCMSAGASGLARVGQIAQQGPPSPEWYGVVLIVAFVGSLGGCIYAGGRSIHNSLTIPRIVKEGNNWLNDALGYWTILRSCRECEEATNEK